MNTRLSVNINKIALLRNARGGNLPNLLQFAQDCERFGAQGITVHPRPDERHIRYDDCYALKPLVNTEFNIEGYPDERFMQMVCEVKPHQCTLVPDDPKQLTSDHGWDTVKCKSQLQEVISELKSNGIRVSIFIDPVEQMLEGAAETGTDRIEYYTGPYAEYYQHNREEAVKGFKETATFAHSLGLGINAGHDLNLDNLKYFADEVPHLAEVSIGHALVTDALYYGIENTIQMYLRRLEGL